MPQERAAPLERPYDHFRAHTRSNTRCELKVVLGVQHQHTTRMYRVVDTCVLRSQTHEKKRRNGETGWEGRRGGAVAMPQKRTAPLFEWPYDHFRAHTWSNTRC